MIALALVLGLPADESPNTARPNVVLIMADDVGRECFGCYGSEQYRTPNLDRLAAGGVRFTNCHSQPLCTPSRVKLMTGRGNHENYVGFSILPRDERTIGQCFQEAGYATAIAGKWQLLGARNYPERFRFRGSWPENVGFDRYCLWQVTEKPSRYWEPGLRIDGEFRQFKKKTYGPDVVNEFVLDFIAEQAKAGRPFFVYYPMILVHDPFLPTPDSSGDRPRKKQGKHAQANFEDMVAYMDKLIGRTTDRLQALGISENTLVLFVGDNGTHKSITSVLDGRKIVGGKGSTKNRGTHVPLIASWPGVTQGTVCENLVDFTDFLPTVLEAANIEAPPKATGVSFLPQIRGEAGTPRGVTTCYYWPRPERGEAKRYAFDGRYKLYGNGSLYDTAEDPEEKRALGEGHAARATLGPAVAALPPTGRRVLDLDDPKPRP